jgi:predicted lipoprotein with Yx(FWY)xxD motif
MKKSSTVIGLVILVVIAIGAYALLHNKSTKSNTTNSNTSTTSNSTVTPVNNAVVITKTNSSLGQYLAEPNGQTLYTYSADTSGVSNCTGTCLASWPPYQDMGSTTGLPTGISTIKRTDNSETQYTYNGKPLYTFVNDSVDQVTGNGQSNFTVAKPAASSSSSSSSQSTTPTSSNSSSSSNYNYNN